MRFLKNYKHGFSDEKLYVTWNNMVQRCNNPNNKRYKDYGGRGITVCPEWTNDYVKFRDWSLSNGYQEGLTIDRINNDGNYEPNNCRFITNKEQQRNRRNNKISLEKANEIREKYVTVKYTQKELAEEYSVNQRMIRFILANKYWI